MKYDLPPDHGLSEVVAEKLVFREGEKFALTDAQHAALVAGVGRGESVLVLSPTSTGKTQIAVWAIAQSVQRGCNTVYLVTHRALAKQKFQDFKTLLLKNFLGDNGAVLVIATGDAVEDANGDVPGQPLVAPLLVATYEKYLALLSASGIPSDMKHTVIVCDEIQLIGDEARGQHVEVLLTLLRNAGWKQFVGLSAVLQDKDARELASWLGVSSVVQHAREKHLQYECWSSAGMSVVSTEKPDRIVDGVPIPAGCALDAVSVVKYLLTLKKPPLPIIVFCMRKQDTYELAERFLDVPAKTSPTQLSLAFDELPDTNANAFLAKALGRRVASHNADLTDDERGVVEQHLQDGKLDVVFATSTLAAGVNFPLGAAVFAAWSRWDSDKRAHIPIDSAEFHNMAGRVGRMGFQHAEGRVIFCAPKPQDAQNARRYLELGQLGMLAPRINPERFNQLALQLIASGLCETRDEILQLVTTTFSGQREATNNQVQFAKWPGLLSSAINELIQQVLILETGAGRLVATAVGRAIAHSGLLPESGLFLLTYMVKNAESLAATLPTPAGPGDLKLLSFLLACACYSSPEFRPTNHKPPTRFLPWPLNKGTLFDADPLAELLPDPVWQADIPPINAAKLSVDWIEGAELRGLEAELQHLSAGMLREMYRNLAWVLQGLASILDAATGIGVPPASKPVAIASAGTSVILLRKFPRLIRRLSYRVSEGLPEDVMWMQSINHSGGKFRLTRSEILVLRKLGFTRPEQVMLGSPQADEVRVLACGKAKPSPQAKANWLRDACRDWKRDVRNRAAERHIKRAKKCARIDLVAHFYQMRGTEFEKAFEAVLADLKISFVRLDDKTKIGAPDYKLEFSDSPPLVLELKSKQGDNLVDYNSAVEVLAASEVHGLKTAFCVTLCHPGVDPSVPVTIAACGRLSVVESNDLGEALLRLCEGSMSQSQLYTWLASPGQALAGDLPFRDYS